MTSLFFVLLVCHWLGDFTHLSSPEMLAAKKFGTPLDPIILHALVHALLVLFATMFYTTNAFIWFYVYVFELSSHFIIDLLKGKSNKWFPILQDPTKYWHWWIFGLDQMLHVSVLFIIYLIITNGSSH